MSTRLVPALLQPRFLGLLALAALPPQDWYVDVNAPGCAVGTGTQLDPFCNVMDAVNAASSGDTIHVAPGDYFENVLLDKDLTLIGTGGSEVTILDGMQSGSVVRVRDAAITLTGLTLTNGSGTTYGLSAYTYGGGLFIYSPLDLRLPVDLSGCDVLGNRAHTGAGISNGTNTYLREIPGGCLTVAGTAIHGNHATFRHGPGGGLFSSSLCLTTITNSSVCGNRAGGSGGGASIDGPLALSDSVVGGNEAQWGQGGGLFCREEATITNSTISSNTTYYYFDCGSGGGVFLLGDATVANTEIHDNWGGGSGGGVFSAGNLTLTNTSLAGNRGGEFGGSALYVHSQRHALLANVTLADNRNTDSCSVGRGGGNAIFVNYESDLTIENSILWRNGPTSIELYGTATATVDYTLIQGGWPGIGNLDQNPKFVDFFRGDFRLSSASPCIDAGDNTVVPLGITTDLLGLPRFVDDPLTPDTGVGGPPTVDMGAFEMQPPGIPPTRHGPSRDASGFPLTPIQR